MGRAFGILMLVVGLWVGLTIYTEGFDNAFGGRLAFLSEEKADGDTRPPTERVRDKISQAHAEAEARREKLLRE
jgi:hypothetical protein